MATEIKVGDDVFIVEKNREDLSIFDGKDGMVKSVDGNKAIVHFYPCYSSLFGYEYRQGITTKEFDLDELKVFDLREHPQIRAERLYHDSYHHLYVCTYKFSPKNLCMRKDCKELAVKRILYNCWGTVREFDTCEVHSNVDGFCGDGFYGTPNYVPTVQEMYE